jgi:hypothetical protein
MKFIISGSIRSKKNHRQIFGAGKFKVNLPPKAYLKWEKNAHKELNIQDRGELVLFNCAVRIKATFFYKGARPDLSAGFEALADCIQGYLINNDRQIESWDGSRMIHDKDNPRTEFEIEVFEG